MKRLLVLLGVLTVAVLIVGCSDDKEIVPDEVYKAQAKPIVSLHNEYDDSAFESVPEESPVSDFKRSDAFYGLTYEIPGYMNKSDDGSSGYQTYSNYDGNPVSYVSCQVLTDAWPDVELKDMMGLTGSDVVYEGISGDKDNGYRGSAHYFFTTDKTNAGEHEMQVLVSVSAIDEDTCSGMLAHIMESMDFSDFYFDDFAEG